MATYNVTTIFGAKDDLISGAPAKKIKGSEFTTEFTNISTAVNSKADTTTVNAVTTTANAALPKSGGAMTGAITTNSTFDGVDIATRDAVLTTTTTTANAALPKAGGAMTGPITTNSTFDGVDIATRDGVLTTTTNTADAALPKAGGTMSGAIAMGTSKITGAGDPTDAQDVATKAYVDANAGSGDVTLSGNNAFTGNNTFSTEIAANAGIALGDNDKLTFGTSDDLELYHDGSNSIIKDSGTGILKYTSNTAGVAGVTFQIENTDQDAASGCFIEFKDSLATNTADTSARIGAIASNLIILTVNSANANQPALECLADDGVKLYSTGTGATGLRLQTTTTGVTVTGAVSLSTLLRVSPSAQPSSGSTAGDVYYDSTSNKLRCYNGSAWNDLF